MDSWNDEFDLPNVSIKIYINKIKKRYSTESRVQMYEKDYELLSFEKKKGKNLSKNLSCKYIQKLFVSAKINWPRCA